MSDDYQKVDHGLLSPLAQPLTNRIIPLIPVWVTPNLITIFGFAIAVIIAFLYYLASFNKTLLLATPLLICIRWLLDHLDGQVARARNQTSERGFFLDLFLDSLSFTVGAIAIGLASYSIFELWAMVLVITLLRYLLALFRILLKKEFIIPTVGIDEGCFLLALTTILNYVYYDKIFQIFTYSFSCFDIFALIYLFLGSFEFLKFSWQLYCDLDKGEATS